MKVNAAVALTLTRGALSEGRCDCDVCGGAQSYDPIMCISRALFVHRPYCCCSIKLDRTVNVNCSEKSLNESLEGLGEVIVGLAHTVILQSLLKLVNWNLSILKQVLIWLLQIGSIQFEQVFSVDDLV